MRFFVLFVCLLISINVSFGQDCSWAKRISGMYLDNASSVAVDEAGNVYMTGYFGSPTLSFNNGVSITNSGTNYDVYIAKYNSNGLCQWARRVGGDGDDYAFSIAVDNSGNVYVAGCFLSSTLNFNNGISLSNWMAADGYIAKYNSTGTCQWANRIAGTGADVAQSITVDANENVFVAGTFYSSTVVFNPNSYLELYNVGESDAYFAKYSSAGACLWANRIGGLGFEDANGIKVDANGYIYIVGNFSSYFLNFFNGITVDCSGSLDAFIAKYDSTGLCQWVGKTYGTNAEYGVALAVDESGNVYITGEFASETVPFNNEKSVNLVGWWDSYIAKFNSNGICQWATSVSGPERELANTIAVDKYENVYVAGEFGSPTVNFNNEVSLANSGNDDVFFAKYNSTGICQWAEKIASTDDDYAKCIAVDQSNKLYITGDYFYNTITFNNGKSLTNSGYLDVYLAKYNLPLEPLDAPILSNPTNEAVNVLITPVFEWLPVEFSTYYTLQISQTEDFSDSVIIINGLELTTFHIDSMLFNTTYFWRVNANDGTQTGDWSEIWSFTTEKETIILPIKLKIGWNLISSNVIPEDQNMSSIFSDVQNLVIVKNSAGEIYTPNFKINSIGDWDVTEGYFVYVSSPTILNLRGVLDEPTTPINLNEGWNLVSYLPNIELSAPNALESIESNLIFAKDRLGNIYHLIYGINTIGNLKAGKGYWMYVNSDCQLIYPNNGNLIE